MARTLEEIREEIIERKESCNELNGLDSSSKTAIWRLWIYITAFAIWTLEKLFDQHRNEVDEMLKQRIPHTARWYRNKALDFLLGVNLMTDSDKYPDGVTDIENKKIIKYAAVVEIGSRLIIKIATEKDGELGPIDSDNLEGFTRYIQEIKDVGVRFNAINYLPDLLVLNIEIYRDPLVLDDNGNHRTKAIEPVKIALNEFMKELPFNGELILQELANKLEGAEGVRIVNIKQASTAWIDSETLKYGEVYEDIDVKKIPESGYFKIVYQKDVKPGDTNYTNIKYVV